MTMKNPPHPGRIVRQECIEPLGLTITDAAERLGIKRQTLNNLVNGKAGISPEMSIRLSKAFGSSPEVWLGMQMEYDLAKGQQERRPHQGPADHHEPHRRLTWERSAAVALPAGLDRFSRAFRSAAAVALLSSSLNLHLGYIRSEDWARASRPNYDRR